MRKKEVTYKIKTILDDFQNYSSNKIKAEIILNELISLGMLPPSISRIRKDKLDRINYIEILEHVNEWEVD